MYRFLISILIICFSLSLRAQEVDSVASEIDTITVQLKQDTTTSRLANSDSSAAQSDTIRIRISAIGDIMAHQTQLNAQRQADGSYDFTNNFNYVKPLFEASDLMIANLETTLAGPAKGYSAYPRFNTPDAMAYAMKYAGINLVATANNHCYDTKTHGLRRTIKVLDSLSLPYTGTRLSDTVKNYQVFTYQDKLKVGVTAFTFESGRVNGLKTINGIKVAPKDTELINSYNPYDAAGELSMLENAIANMKKDSADIVVVIMHWGNEYELEPSQNQLLVAKKLNNMGVDIVFGSHPHVVQPIDFIHNDSSEQTTFVAYSLGNFISNQRYETLDNYNTEDGLFSTVTVRKVSGKQAEIESVENLALWVRRYRENYRYHYYVIPAEKAMSDLRRYGFENQNEIGRLHSSYNRTEERIYNRKSITSKDIYEQYIK